jgi:Zn-dependent protease with chaperone function
VISGTIGLILNLLMVGILSFVAALVTVSALGFFTRGLSAQFSATARRHLLWGLVVLPWLASLVSVCVLIMPELINQQLIWPISIMHFHHAREFNFLSWHGATLLMFCGIFILMFSQKLLNAVKTAKDLTQLDYFSEVSGQDKSIAVLQTDIPAAFTSGLFRPRCYLTTGLLAKLNAQECDIVKRHEIAHARNFDPLSKYAFSLFAAFFPRAIGERFNRAMALAIEQSADEAVLSHIHDDALISKTILKVLRLCHTNNGSPAPLFANCHFVDAQLRQRVHYLMSTDKGRSFPAWLYTLLATCLMVTSTLSVDLLHHTVELIFTH